MRKLLPLLLAVVGCALPLAACGGETPKALPAHVHVVGGQYVVEKGWSNLGHVLCEEGLAGINWHTIPVPTGEIIVCERGEKSFKYGPEAQLP